MALIVTGTIGIDTVHTPHGNAERIPGGSAAYFGAAASVRTPVRLVGAVGDDWPDDHHETLVSFDGLDLHGLERRSGSQTFAWGGRYFDDMNQRETLFTELGVLEEDPPPVPDAFRDSQFVFLANSHPGVQGGFLDQFPDRRLAVVDTMDLWINIAHEELTGLLGRVDGVVLNDAEAAQLTEQRNAVTAGRAILDLGPTFAVVKKGEHGAILVHRDGVATLPAFPAEQHQVVDPTGAGDSFAGGMMAHLAVTERTDFEAIQSSLAWGTVTASFTIESHGLSGLQALTLERLEERLAAFRSAVRID